MFDSTSLFGGQIVVYFRLIPHESWLIFFTCAPLANVQLMLQPTLYASAQMLGNLIAISSNCRKIIQQYYGQYGNYGQSWIVWKSKNHQHFFRENLRTVWNSLRFFSDCGQCLRLRWISLVRRGSSSVGLHVVFAAWRRRRRLLGKEIIGYEISL